MHSRVTVTGKAEPVGIIYSSAVFLAEAKMKGVCFDTILTIGHLSLYLSRKQIHRLAKHYGMEIDSSVFSDPYANKFFEILFGAKSVTSLDYSDYEQSDIVHDMNQPVDPKYHAKFDVVIDGGSLEHIFHFPVAVANCMNMVKKGGSIFIFSPANNHTGHGFYQFSPELFFRIFQPGNGFEVRNIILEQHPFPGAELSPKTKCYSVADPACVNGRVGLVSKSPVTMMVHAIRTEAKPLFADYPIQSDYASRLLGNVKNGPNRSGNAAAYGFSKTWIKKIFRHLPLPLKNYLYGNYQLLRYSFSNKRFYKRWKPL